MKREPMVFFAAGTIFGVALGYMASHLGDRPEARPAASRAAEGSLGPAAAPGEAAPAGATAAPPLDPDEVRALESLARKDAANAKVRADLGNLYMDHGRYDDAGRWYREALALDAENADVRVDLGACLVNGGKPTEGLEEFNRVLKKSPDHKKAAFNKGIALMALGRPREAVALWQDLAKRYPGDPQLRGLEEQIGRVRATLPQAPS